MFLASVAGKEAIVRGRQWSVLAVLALLVYIMLASMFNVVSKEFSYAGPPPTRTPCASFTPTYPPQIVELVPTPTATRVIAAPLRASGAPAYAQDGRLTYVVQPGDSLPDVAQHYGVSLQAVLHLNGLADPNGLAWGQTLIIPGLNESPAESEVEPSATPMATTAPTRTRRPRPPSPTPTLTPSPAPTATPMPVYVAPPPVAAHAAATVQPCDKVDKNGKCRCWKMKGGHCKHEHPPSAPD
jgi:LysM repeat protein